VEHVIDVSDLEPPEPLERILDALADLPEGDYLRVLHHREPVPLYRMLQAMRYRWFTRESGEAGYEIFIWEAGLEPPDPVRGLVQFH
jgi:uncharacterized protein (DUF2249 family)